MAKRSSGRKKALTEFSLSVAERLSLQNILPVEGTVLTMRLVRGVVEKTSLSAREISAWEVQQNGSSVQWNMKKAKNRTIAYNTLELNLIVTRLTELDHDEKIRLDLLGLYEKFIPRAPEEA